MSPVTGALQEHASSGGELTEKGSSWTHQRPSTSSDHDDYDEDNNSVPLLFIYKPPLWSSGQSSWLQTQRTRVRFPPQPDFMSSSGSETGFTQPL
jgi:hypothetical protein